MIMVLWRLAALISIVASWFVEPSTTTTVWVMGSIIILVICDACDRIVSKLEGPN